MSVTIQFGYVPGQTTSLHCPWKQPSDLAGDSNKRLVIMTDIGLLEDNEQAEGLFLGTGHMIAMTGYVEYVWVSDDGDHTSALSVVAWHENDTVFDADRYKKTIDWMAEKDIMTADAATWYFEFKTAWLNKPWLVDQEN